MIIDVETYYNPGFALAGLKGIALLRQQLDEAGIDRAMLFPEPKPLATDNEGAYQVVQADSRFIGVASVNPHLGAEGCDLLRRSLTEWGFRGLKLMPVHYAFRSVSTLADPLIKIAGEFNVPVTIHSGNFFCHPLEIAQMARRFPDVMFIMDHMGYRYYVQEAILAAEQNPNLFLATTAVFEPHFIAMALDKVGVERVVFGSNAPMVIPRLQLEVIRALKLSADEEAAIFCGNAMRLYGLN
ncbi:MAG: amidohydrolase [Anaerolinea sp.]|nr:amidohydrolase [Anaerolinea sp.]